MTHTINWIKFKIQKVLGVHELNERVEILENEVIRLNIKVYAAEDGVNSIVSNVDELFATTSELSRATNQTDNLNNIGNKNQQLEKEEIDYIQKSYE